MNIFNFFSSFKSYFSPEQYLTDVSFERKLRNNLARFRLGVSQINLHRYKFYKNNDTLLKCPFCKNCIEDEPHIIFDCPAYDDLRSNSQLSVDCNVVNKEYYLFSIMNNFNNQKTLSIFLTLLFKKRRSMLEERENV